MLAHLVRTERNVVSLDTLPHTEGLRQFCMNLLTAVLVFPGNNASCGVAYILSFVNGSPVSAFLVPGLSYVSSVIRAFTVLF
jgi:hypothetical protein